MKFKKIIESKKNKEEVGLFLVDIEKEISIDVQLVVLPKNIQRLFEHNEDTKHFSIYPLNNTIQCINEYCFAKFQNNSNYKDGWVYILNNSDQEYVDKVIRNIKYITRYWLKDHKDYLAKKREKYIKKGEEVPMNIQNPYNLLSSPAFIDETLNQIKCTPHTLKISLESLKDKVNRAEKSIFLYALSTILSKNLKIEYTFKKGGITDTKMLDFYKVNMMHSDSSVRVMTYMPSWTEDSKKNKCMYAYYLDVYINDYPNEEFPKIVLSPGSTRLRAESIESNYFSTTSKNIYPFIFLNSDSRLVDDPGCNVFIQGKIINEDKNPRWDTLFENSFKRCLIELPTVREIYASPESYLYDDGKTKVYIPHGTHFRKAKHNAGAGVDVDKRNLICDSAHKIISENFSNVSKKVTIIPQIGTSKRICSATSKDFDNFNLVQGDVFEFDVIYTSESFKNLMEKIQKYYNSWNFSDLDILNDEDRTLKASCYTLRSILENTKKETFNYIKKNTTIEDLYAIDLDPIKDLPKTKIKVNLINQISDLKLKLEIEKLNKDNINVVKGHLQDNKKAFRKNIKTASKGAIIEVKNKSYFSNKLVDLKKSFKHNLCCVNKVSQVINYNENKSEKDRYYVIFKCITELLRQEGYLKTEPGRVMDIYESRFNIEKTGHNSLHVGLCYIQSFKCFSYAAIYKGRVYGLKDNEWVAINESMCSSGKVTWDKESIGECYDKYEIEKNLNKLYAQLTRNSDLDVSHIVLYIDGVSVKKKIPAVNEPGENFNLLISKDFTDYHATREEATLLSKKLYDKLSVIEINGESSGYCPEWFEIKNGEPNYKAISSGRFIMLNESVFFSIAEKTVESKMMYNIHKVKDTEANLNFRKETAIMIHVLKSKENYPNILLAAYAHLLRHKTSIQFLGGSATFPLPLDIARKNKEYKFMMKDLIVSDEDEYEEDIDADNDEENDIADIIRDSEDALRDDIDNLLEESELDIFSELADF